MKALVIILDILVVITSILLTLLILMHKGKGGGLSDMFGASAGGRSASTSGVAEKNLNRITVIVALIWVLTIIGLGLLTRFGFTAW